MLKYLARTFSIAVTVSFAILTATWPMRADLLDGAMVAGRNILPPNVQTQSYAANTSDCFRPMVQMGIGSTAQTTVTLPPSTSVPNGCKITVKNGDIYTGSGTGHAITPTGFPTDIPAFIWPQQVSQVVSTSSGWQTSRPPGRWQIPQEAEICVAQDGVDTNDGLNAGTSCMGHIQTAVNAIYQQWDANNFPPDIGLYGTGTGTLTETVSFQGQITGYNFIRFRTRATNTWTSTANCVTTNDNAEAIFDATFGFTQTWQCNTGNTANKSALFIHGPAVNDILGAHKWIPGGANDNFLFVDKEGDATISGSGAGIILGTGAQSSASFVTCNYHCAGVTVGGTMSYGGAVNITAYYILKAGSVIDHSANPTGGAGTIGVAVVNGLSILRENGLTPPGGAPTTANGGVVCPTSC